jgi:chromosome segregation ATPase
MNARKKIFVILCSVFIGGFTNDASAIDWSAPKTKTFLWGGGAVVSLVGGVLSLRKANYYKKKLSDPSFDAEERVEILSRISFYHWLSGAFFAGTAFTGGMAIKNAIAWKNGKGDDDKDSKTKLKKKEAELKKKEAELKKLRAKELHNKGVCDLMKKELDKKFIEIGKLRKDIAMLSDDYVEAQKGYEGKISELEKLIGDQKLSSEKQEEVDGYKKELEGKYVERMEALSNEIRNKGVALEEHKKNYRLVEQEYNELAERFNRLDGEKQTLTLEFERFKTGHKKDQETFEGQKLELKNREEEVGKKIEAFEAIKLEVKKKAADVEKVKLELKELREEHGGCEKVREEKDNKIKNLDSKNRQHKKFAETQRKANVQLEKKNVGLEKEIKRLAPFEKELKVLLSKFEETAGELKRVKTANEKLKSLGSTKEFKEEEFDGEVSLDFLDDPEGLEKLLEVSPIPEVTGEEVKEFHERNIPGKEKESAGEEENSEKGKMEDLD